MDQEWILLKEQLFGSPDGTAECSDNPKEEDTSNDEARPDDASNGTPSSDPGLYEDSACEGECSDDERSDDGLLDDPSCDVESSNDSSSQNHGFWQYICNICSKVWDSIKTGFQKVFDSIKSACSWLWDILSEAGSWVKEHLDNFLSKITQIFMGSNRQNMGEYVPLVLMDY